jgi:hypothetical protein
MEAKHASLYFVDKRPVVDGPIVTKVREPLASSKSVVTNGPEETAAWPVDYMVPARGKRPTVLNVGSSRIVTVGATSGKRRQPAHGGNEGTELVRAEDEGEGGQAKQAVGR